jgi:hypothetical protein
MQDQGGRRSNGATPAGIVRADDWSGPWSDISVELLQSREVYRSDIKNAEWKTLVTHVDTLTFEKLGVKVLRRQMFDDLPVSGKLCLNTHALGRQCQYEKLNTAGTCKAAKNHTNPNNGQYVNMRLGVALRAKILLDGGVKKIPKRS